MVGRIRIRDGPRVENRCSFIEKHLSISLAIQASGSQ